MAELSKKKKASILISLACTCFIYSHKKKKMLEWNVWEIIEVI